MLPDLVNKIRMWSAGRQAEVKTKEISAEDSRTLKRRLCVGRKGCILSSRDRRLTVQLETQAPAEELLNINSKLKS